LSEGEIHFFLEAGCTIGTCPINGHWMELAFGTDERIRSAASPVSCAGTLVASPQGLMVYLIEMCRFILRTPHAARYSGIDQAIHNHIVMYGLVPDGRIVANGQAVMTIPTDRPHGITVSETGELRNADGSMSEIVHQYDRDPFLLAAIARRYEV
jgi:hypothetical protein